MVVGAQGRDCAAGNIGSCMYAINILVGYVTNNENIDDGDWTMDRSEDLTSQNQARFDNL